MLHGDISFNVPCCERSTRQYNLTGQSTSCVSATDRRVVDLTRVYCFILLNTPLRGWSLSERLHIKTAICQNSYSQNFHFVHEPTPALQKHTSVSVARVQLLYRWQEFQRVHQHLQRFSRLSHVIMIHYDLRSCFCFLFLVFHNYAIRQSRTVFAEPRSITSSIQANIVRKMKVYSEEGVCMTCELFWYIAWDNTNVKSWRLMIIACQYRCRWISSIQSFACQRGIENARGYDGDEKVIAFKSF